MVGSREFGFVTRFLTVAAYASSMAYLESAVVVYLQRALSITPLYLFPLRDQATLGGLGSIELGREVATLVMLATVGCLAGRTPFERLAWTSVAFGIWDMGYYFWLWAFIGWPTSLGTTDLLFLLPVPWVAPVWAPVLVSLALSVFGLIVAHRIRKGPPHDREAESLASSRRGRSDCNPEFHFGCRAYSRWWDAICICLARISCWSGVGRTRCPPAASVLREFTLVV